MASDEQKLTTPESEFIERKADESVSVPASPSLGSQKEKGKGKEQTTSQSESTAGENQEKSEDTSDSSPAVATGTSSAQPWQAIFAPQYNTYYFYNSQTGETTWSNPLHPSEPTTPDPLPSDTVTLSDPTLSDPEPSTSTSQYTALQAAALAQGIDPSLAHLDPSLLTGTTSASGGGPIPSFQAKFNARTGAFTRPDARTPGHLSEYERMKRMSEFYFDVNAWEEQLAEEKTQDEEGNGKKRKRPTKKDLERFKEQKRQKKIAKTAWLRT